MSCPKPIHVVVAEVQRAARRNHVQRIIRHARVVDADDIAQTVFLHELERKRDGRGSAVLDGDAHPAIVMKVTRWQALDAARAARRRPEDPFLVDVNAENGHTEALEVADEATPSPIEVIEQKHDRDLADAVVAKIQERARAVDADVNAKPTAKRTMGLVLSALAGVSMTALAALVDIDVSCVYRSIHGVVDRAVAAEIHGDPAPFKPSDAASPEPVIDSVALEAIERLRALAELRDRVKSKRGSLVPSDAATLALVPGWTYEARGQDARVLRGGLPVTPWSTRAGALRFAQRAGFVRAATSAIARMSQV